MSRNKDGKTGSRVNRRANTKALVCMACQRRIKGRSGVTPRTVMSFRGYSQARLGRHIREVHSNEARSK